MSSTDQARPTDQAHAAATPSDTAVTGPARASRRVHRGPVLIGGLAAGSGAVAIYSSGLPMIWQISQPAALTFGVLAAAQLGTGAAVAARPTRARLLAAGIAAGAGLGWWLLASQLAVLPEPNPWLGLDQVLGITDRLVAALAATAVALLWVSALRARPESTRPAGRRVLRTAAWVALAPVLALLVAVSWVGVAGASDLLSEGAGLPAGTVAPRNLPAGARSTVEYCRPAGIGLAMDLYTPSAGAPHPAGGAPVAVFVHGGGFVLGDRQTRGLGDDVLADPSGLLFPQLTAALTARGFVVAAPDYRLAPATAWPAPITDVKCAIRFLRAHATGLGIDPTRIGAWGGSAGATLVSLLALTGPQAGFDVGQYLDQPSQVQAAIDMFGPADLTHLGDSAGWAQAMVTAAFGGSTQVRAAASPDTYATSPAPGAPPLLILQGRDDPVVPPHQSIELAARLRTAHIPTRLVMVAGAGHGFTASPDQHPSLDQLAATATTFFTTTLR